VLQLEASLHDTSLQPQQSATNLALPASASARKYWTQPPWPSWCFNTCTWYTPCPPASFHEPSSAHKFSNTSHTGRKKVLRWRQLELLTRKTQGAGGQGYSTGQRLDQSQAPSTAHRCPSPPLSWSVWPFTFLSPCQQCLDLNLNKYPDKLLLQPCQTKWPSVVSSSRKLVALPTNCNQQKWRYFHEHTLFLKLGPPKILQVQNPCRNLYIIVC
jgi:hypothetical protein